MLRVGVVPGVDTGIRYNGANLKGDVKVRLWQSSDEKRVLSAMAGVGRQTIDLPKIVQYVTLSECKRTDADISLMYGNEPFSFLKTYIGIRSIYSWVSAKPMISDRLMAVVPQEYQEMSPANYLGDETILYIGGTGGVMLGYEWIWLNLEATVLYMDFQPTISDRKRNLSGWQIAPVASLMFEF